MDILGQPSRVIMMCMEVFDFGDQLRSLTFGFCKSF